MLFNADWFFQDSTGRGWSERYFVDAGDITAAQTAQSTVVVSRLDLLPVGDAIIAQRISTPGKPPNSLLLTQAFGGLPGTYALAGGQVLPVDNCALLTLRGNDTLKNKKFLRRLVTTDVTGDNFTPSAPWLTNLVAFSTALTANGFVVASTYTVLNIPPRVFTTIELVTVAPVVHYRKAGRPFGGLPGRRRIRLSH